ncbi:acetyl-CoA carboxylase carboxyltransferase subunit alpha [Nosocomiicoccus sp. HMSC09A07]|uniref:acetyl-CoA carboxylase carboxyltransferase subunit alpha n=1 Tax=Nosocomiicoccus sp. HMSC09A07 TaxID=1581145 RepID=UPI0008A50A37|nr:acetyl-CoA carboxylase carboxyltransferase subunit alpha [Nosocomiicoccus sp. HMSC09A07]OFS63899.1 acetyl-CoA carboxylase carboxyltransferase subunit alpha [Nosocomiicoccus sp. HMSC09A07]
MSETRRDTVQDLKDRIEELKGYEEKNNIDLSKEIDALNDKIKMMTRTLTPWQQVELARKLERPTTLEYIEAICDEFIEFAGDRAYGDDRAIIGGVASINGTPVTVIGHQRGMSTRENIKRNFGMPHPEGYRKALRLMEQAEKFKRPIVTFIDTKGAYPGKEAEERGQSEAIAKNLVKMAGFNVPIISIVIGEGGSGGALGIGVCDHLYMLENSTYSVISPEGAASILFKDASLKEVAAKSLKLTAADLYELGVADFVIEEPEGGAHVDKPFVYKQTKEAIINGLEQLSEIDDSSRLDVRFEKYMAIGDFKVKDN